MKNHEKFICNQFDLNFFAVVQKWITHTFQKFEACVFGGCDLLVLSVWWLAAVVALVFLDIMLLKVSRFINNNNDYS